jgi:hypothetical protein
VEIIDIYIYNEVTSVIFNQSALKWV